LVAKAVANAVSRGVDQKIVSRSAVADLQGRSFKCCFRSELFICHM